MQRKTVSVIILTLLAASGLILAFRIQRVKAGTITVPYDYPTIQEAINHANAGDTIFVKSGTYSGPIVIDKSLSLEGENKETTIIDGGSNEPYGSIVLVLANNVMISQFTIQHSRAGGNAIWIDGYNYSHISNNIIANNGDGIRILHSFGNTVKNNLVKNNPYTAIGFNWAFDNAVQNNTIIKNLIGIGGGFEPCYNNIFWENTIANNTKGIEIDYSDSKFFHNNIITNTYQVVVYTSDFDISWDDGYPSGGNYWSDYVGADKNHDGIGDTPYIIDSNSQDRYPLMTPYPDLSKSLLQPEPSQLGTYFSIAIIASGIALVIIGIIFRKREKWYRRLYSSSGVLLLFIFKKEVFEWIRTEAKLSS